MRLEIGKQLTEVEALNIQNEGERLFALACISVGVEVYSQIPVGISNIDFFVVNPKAFTVGKLVEVTMEKKEDLDKKFVTIEKCGVKRRVLNTTGPRKKRQMESMKQSGHKWTILFDREVNNLRNR